MKVCTDACLFGGWMGEAINNYKNKIHNSLDIGCGTGLLSLMLAQNCNTFIDAIEIDKDAAEQAKENTSATPWRDSIKIHNESLQAFIPEKKYDFIFSNPPFYEADLKSVDAAKNAAKHDSTLTLNELIEFISMHLNETGLAAILLPYHRSIYFEELLASHSMNIVEKVSVKQSPKHNHFRSMFLFSKSNANQTIIKELTIHDEERNYTDDFKTLLKDYYLHL